MEILLVFGIILAAVLLFAWDRLPVDLVALLVLSTLMLTGLVTPAEGVSGFSNPATITVLAMLILSGGLNATGALDAVGRWLVRRAGASEPRLVLALMLVIGALSSVINNTAAVAVFLPLVVGIARKQKLSASRLLIPLSFASMFGGVNTLIGTSTNLVVSAVAADHGLGAFRMFEFLPLGLVLSGVGIAYLLTAGRRLLPARRSEQSFTEDYRIREYLTELRVVEGSPLVGQTAQANVLAERFEIDILEILRGDRRVWWTANPAIEAGDLLLVRARADDLLQVKTVKGVEVVPEAKFGDPDLAAEEMVLAEVVVGTNARVIGRTLKSFGFHRRFGVMVLAIAQRGRTVRAKLGDVRLRFGDTLLALGPREAFRHLVADPDFLVLEEVERPILRAGRAPAALAITGAVVILAALEVVPILVGAVAGATLMVVTRCLTMEEAYQAVDWKTIFLLAGVIPLGIAMERTGAAEALVAGGLGAVGGWGPTAALAGLYLLTATLTSFMSNNATAILLAPIAISTAAGLAVSPKPLLMAVTFAASASFATPVGYQTNVLIYGPGGYRYLDFTRVGLPLTLLFWVLASLLIPVFWPF